MEITAQFKVHSRTDTESAEREYVLTPLHVEDVVDDVEAITDEEFYRRADEMEGFGFASASTVRVGPGAVATTGIVIRSAADMEPGWRVTLTLSRVPEPVKAIR